MSFAEIDVFIMPSAGPRNLLILYCSILQEIIVLMMQRLLISFLEVMLIGKYLLVLDSLNTLGEELCKDAGCR